MLKLTKFRNGESNYLNSLKQSTILKGWTEKIQPSSYCNGKQIIQIQLHSV
jgi:hypothetical protein